MAEYIWTKPDGKHAVGYDPPVAGSKPMLDLKGVSREECEAKCTAISVCGAYASVFASGANWCNLYSGNWKADKLNSDKRYKCYEREKAKQVFNIIFLMIMLISSHNVNTALTVYHPHHLPSYSCAYDIVFHHPPYSCAYDIVYF